MPGIQNCMYAAMPIIVVIVVKATARRPFDSAESVGFMDCSWQAQLSRVALNSQSGDAGSYWRHTLHRSSEYRRVIGSRATQQDFLIGVMATARRPTRVR